MALISIDAMSNEICKISDSFHHTKFALSLVHFVARCGQFLVFSISVWESSTFDLCFTSVKFIAGIVAIS